MSRCRSWRPSEAGRLAGHPANHQPGECRKCWRPCFNRVEEGCKRCVECADLLAEHANPGIRLALASESDLPDRLLRLMATDLDVMVAQTAQWQIKHRQPNAPHTGQYSAPPTSPAAQTTPDQPERAQTTALSADPWSGGWDSA
jgi:hypothetical protein